MEIAAAAFWNNGGTKLANNPSAYQQHLMQMVIILNIIAYRPITIIVQR